MRMRRTASLFLALALTAGLAACGDDDDSGGDALEDVEGAGGSGESTEDTADGDVDGEDSDIAEGFVGEGCTEFAQAFSEASAAAFGGSGGGTDISELAGFFDDAAENAPDEVADALGVFADAYGEFAQALDEAGIDLNDPSAFQDPEAVAVLTEAGEALSSPEVTEAQATIDAFVANNCES